MTGKQAASGPPVALAAAPSIGVAALARAAGPIEARRWPCVERHTQASTTNASGAKLFGHGKPIACISIAANEAIISTGRDLATFVWERIDASYIDGDEKVGRGTEVKKKLWGL